jgi:hypothetical protein
VAVKLNERDDFDQWVIRAAEQSGLPEAFVEKDYYVTEALRAVTLAFPGAVVFKGGTSLSKGWGILERFSEDLDLLIRRASVSPPWTTDGQVMSGLKRVCAVVATVPGFSRDPTRTSVSRPKRRAEFFAYEPRFPEFPGIESGLLLEPGIGSGDWPTTPRSTSSLVATEVIETGMGTEIETDDLAPFEIDILAPERTFVEKLFIAHAAVENHRAGTPIGRRARHFADLAVLAARPEIRDLLADRATYRSIVEDIDRSSREWYGPEHLPPNDLRFADSSVFLSEADLESIRAAYDRECNRLFFGRAYPSLDVCLSRLAALRDQL